MRETIHNDDWTLEIYPKASLFKLNLKEVWRYRDLLILFVRRDFVSVYKQTVLGPLWFIIQPIFTSLVQLFVFTNIAQISTDGIPPILFYLSGNVMWQYFSGCLTLTSNTFQNNAGIFGKVYFPRLITPISLITSQLLKFAVQFGLFLAIWLYFFYDDSAGVINPNWTIALLPILVIIMAGLALGSGMIISALTTKYRDFSFLLSFAVQLLMYSTVVIYPLSVAPLEYRKFIVANPMTPLIETFRYAFTGSGTFSWLYLGYSFVFMVVLMLVGIVVFNKVERTFMDTV
ncbi:ABC transporter permease [Gelidibacter salicanalis]|uniref:Transport permease protein n=1 Tax=Gelidibacter salicanalis TaxID=291193 RepID=A0A934KPN8_9FLAO|nr:ABC transporter permease [Gelidibacter salicanalis]MBJ7879176.1 ABC transporter permease [Gelidibacter salicanalis]